jgi:hypothetical protein
VCNAEGIQLIDFCEKKNGLEILNGKYGSDTGGEFTFVNQLGSSVIDYASASDRIIKSKSKAVPLHAMEAHGGEEV